MEVTQKGKTIGILDIYGFEIFEVTLVLVISYLTLLQLNQFEQLCINYVNEVYSSKNILNDLIMHVDPTANFY